MEAPNVDVLQDLRHASEKWREGCNLLDRAIAVIAAAAHHRQTIMLSPTSLASAAVLNNQTVQLSSARLDNSIAELGIRWDESGFLNDPTATGTPVSLFSRDHKTLLRKGGERRKSSIMAGSMRSIAGKSNSQSPTSSHAKLQMGPKAPSQSSILPSMVNITGVPQQSQSLVQSEKDSRRSSAAPMSRISSVKALKPQAAGKEGSTAHTLVHVPINNQHTAATFSMQILSLIPGKSRAIHASAASLPRHIAGKSQDSVRNAPVLAGNSQHEIASHMQRISHVSSGTAPGHWPGHSQNSIVMGTTRVLGSVDTFESSDAVQMQRNSENLSSTMPRRMLRGGQGSPVASLRVPTSIQNLHAMTASSGSASTHILKAPLPPLLNKQDPGTALLQPNNSSPNSDVSNASQAVRNNAYGLADANQNRETIEPNLDSNNVSSDSLNAELGSCGSLVILEEEELQPPPKIEDARGGGRGEQDVDAFRDSFDSLAMLETAMAMHHAPAFVHQRLKGMHVEATLTTLEEGSGENLKSSEISPPTTLTLQLEDTQLEPTPLLRDKPMPLLEMIGGSHILVNDPQKWRNATWEAWKAWWNERILVFCLTPAFGSNGKMLEREFDLKDLSELSFWVNGFHPKSIFITVYDLILSIELMMVLWLIPFMATFGEENVENECVSIVLTVLFGFNSVIELFTPISKVSKTILCSVREYEEKRPLLSDWTKDWVIREAMIAVATMVKWFSLDVPKLTPFF
ncbi:hypothetical protein BC830DRAFT_1081780 [Chytriomyces sp. MP71]|nr:hypothetical protein BC830DRAFT_1081780 [Chytriomyces sp. MP71]